MSNKINKWLEKIGISSKATPLDKDTTYNIILSDMIQTTLPMLEWKNLPDTMEGWILNLYLQRFGFAVFTKHDGKYYQFYGGLGGEPDVYYLPTIATIANPALKWSAQLELDKNAILIRNDRLCDGLLPWHKLYAYQMAEAFMTLRIGLINSRAEYVISADNDSEEAGAKAFLKNLEDGRHLGHLVNDNFLNPDQMKTLPYSANAINTIRASTESLQYLYSSWCRGVGIESSYNSKREYVAIEATTQPEESTINRPQQMLECAKEACDKINAMYGLNISVDFGSTWKKKEETSDLEQERLEKQVNSDEESKEVEDEDKGSENNPEQ